MVPHDIFHLTELDQHHLSAANAKRSRNFSPKRDSAQPISGQKRRQERVQNWIKLEPKLLFRRQKTELASPHFPRRGADVKIRLESLDSRNPPN